LASAQSGPVTIYLPRLFEDGTLGLRAVTRPQTILDDLARDGLEALIRGPTGDERADDFEYALDPRTRLLGLAVLDLTATADFDSGIGKVYGRPFSELVYWAIVYTLTEAPGTQRVALSERGEPLREIGYPPIPVLAFATRSDAPDWVRPR
jgi:spore germination protein GerM